MNKTEYGYLSYFISLSTFFSLISIFGLNRLVLIKGEDNSNLFFTTIITIFFTSLLTGFLLIPINIASWVFLLSLSVQSIVISFILANQQFQNYRNLRIVQLGTLLLFYLPLTFSMGYNGSILSLSISNCMSLFLIFSELSEQTERIKFDFNIYKSNLRFLVISALLGILGSSTTAIDKLMIEISFGIESLAEFQFSSQFLAALNIIVVIGYSYVQPKKVKREDTKRIERFLIWFSILCCSFMLIGYPLLIFFFFTIYSNTILLGLFLFPNVVIRVLIMLKRADCYAFDKVTTYLSSEILMILIYIGGFVGTKIFISMIDISIVGLFLIAGSLSQYLFLNIKLRSQLDY